MIGNIGIPVSSNELTNHSAPTYKCLCLLFHFYPELARSRRFATPIGDFCVHLGFVDCP